MAKQTDRKEKKGKASRSQPARPRGPMHHLVAPLRRFAPVLAWGSSLGSGLAMPGRMDLLETVIRAGVVWLATWLLCQVGASLAERLGELTESSAASLPQSTKLESSDATA